MFMNVFRQSGGPAIWKKANDNEGCRLFLFIVDDRNDGRHL
jgi:hypothetical protein